MELVQEVQRDLEGVGVGEEEVHHHHHSELVLEVYQQL